MALTAVQTKDPAKHPTSALGQNAKNSDLTKFFSKGVLQAGQGPTDVRFGSKADICTAIDHVRFTPESGHGRSYFLGVIGVEAATCSSIARSGPVVHLVKQFAGFRNLIFRSGAGICLLCGDFLHDAGTERSDQILKFIHSSH
jgi:hypothetical protein